MPIKVQNATAWAKLLAQFGILGRHNLMLDEVVVPVVNLDQSIAFSPKMSGDSVPAVALELGVLGISNPADSGVMVVVDRAWLNTSGTTQVRRDLATVGLTLGVGGTSRDFRQGTAIVHGEVMTGSDPLALGTFVGGVLATQAALSQVYELGIFLPPGSNFAFQQTTFNVLMQGTFFWREILLADFTG